MVSFTLSSKLIALLSKSMTGPNVTHRTLPLQPLQPLQPSQPLQPLQPSQPHRFAGAAGAAMFNTTRTSERAGETP